MMRTDTAGIVALPPHETDAPTSGSTELAHAQNALNEQAKALQATAARLDGNFSTVLDMLAATPGHVIFLGLGKSGLVARKLAATFSSTGAPSLFVHCTEALHGDLGMVTSRDIAIVISYSGETTEVLEVMASLQRRSVPTISFVGNLESRLARGTDIALDISVARETCPNNLAPTTSTLVTMALGDALAVALMRRRQFCAEDFAQLHPGGSLGRRLTHTVKFAMRTSDLPVVAPTTTIGDSLVAMTEGRLGLVLITNGGRLVGLVTDGDLRRAMQRYADLVHCPVSEIMTRNPVTISEDTLLDVALRRMQQMKLKALVAVDKRGRLTGVIDVFNNQ